jgi:uncharacterized membrane protein (UPF0182 family)
MNWISRKTIIIVVAVIVAIIILLVALSGFFVDIFWYSSEGYANVFWTRIWAAVGFGLLVFGLYVVVVGVSLLLAWFFSRQKPHVVSEEAIMLPSFGERLRKWGVWLFIAVGGVFAIINGISAGGEWQVFQRFLHATDFGLRDPIFANDVSFYVFRLPFYRLLYDRLFGAILLSTVLIVVWYVFRRVIWVESWKLRTNPLVKGHVLGMIGSMFALKAWGYHLDKFNILFEDHGKFFGAGYADVNAALPMYNVMFWLTLAFGVAVFVLTWIKTSNLKVILIIVASFIVLPLILLNVVPWAVQTLEVNPNELLAEEGYIGHNIEMTQAAYGLDRITPRAFGESGEVIEIEEGLEELGEILAEGAPEVDVGGASFAADEVEGAGVGPLLTRADIENNRPTIDNIRVWDWHYLRPVYNQIQSFKEYYEFGEDIDIDRYVLGGRQTTVTISLRELNLDGLPPQADTWQNRHLVYTHGYGAVSNPVNLKSPSGQPVFYLQDIPLENRMEVELDRPQVYFGEGNMEYSFAPASEEIEIDYPVGNTNQLTSYDADLGGGIPVGGFWRRLAMAIHLGSLDVLLSDYITPQTRLLIRRNILERVDEVAPYLYTDTDPYPVLTNGGIYWIVDCYTVSSRFPYSQPTLDSGGNYIRNSVKVVVNAYTGHMDFYIVDEDPLIATWSKVFPGMYKDFSEMPPDIRAHLRYPNALFAIQCLVFATYHMSDPRDFYKRSDRWEIPGQPTEGELFSAYYMTMRLPGEAHEEFIVVTPFVPEGKKIMVGWMCARCDPGVYGEMILYTFPRTATVYGPEQIDALINQNPEFSKERTLLGSEGSQVGLGRIVIIPIENSLLYVEPVYIQAEADAIPELKYVLVAYGNQIAMDETLDGALDKLFGPAVPVGEEPVEETPAEVTGEPAPEEVEEVSAPVELTELRSVAREFDAAWTEYNRARAARDWAAFDRAEGRIEELLDRLDELAGGR